MIGLYLSEEVLKKIQNHGAAAYPEEGAGLLLGLDSTEGRKVAEILPLSNSREDEARHNRYLITAEDMLAGEKEAIRLGLDVIGVFHSHPDHPNRPSEFDRDWALPWYSYMITSVHQGTAVESRSWRLSEDRESFREEDLLISKKN
ncbi:MAG: M67 family metallopeptidase [Chloroflexota bacterium]